MEKPLTLSYLQWILILIIERHRVEGVPRWVPPNGNFHREVRKTYVLVYLFYPSLSERKRALLFFHQCLFFPGIRVAPP